MTNETASGRWQRFHHVLGTHPPLAVLIVQFAALPFLSFGAATLSVMAAAGAFALWSAEQTAPYDTQALVSAALKPAGLLVFGLGFWVLLSLVPLGLIAGGHPMWDSIGDALGDATVAHTLTIDKAATFAALAWLLVAATFGFAIVLASVERHSAALLASALMVVASLWAIAALAAPLVFSAAAGSAFSSSGAGGMAGLFAALLLGADLVNDIGRDGRLALHHWTVRARSAGLASSIAAGLAMPGGGVALASGAAVILACALLRATRTGLIERVIAGIIVAAVTGAAAFTSREAADLSVLTLLSNGRVASPEAAQFIADAPRLGFGAGALEGVQRIYLAPGDLWLPSALTRSALELGLPVTLALFSALFGFACFQAQSATTRVRDWTYSASSAAALFAALVAGFYSAAPLGIESLLLVTAIVALGIGQARGRGTERTP